MAEDSSPKAKALAEEKALLNDLTEINKHAAKSVKELALAEKQLAIARRTNSASTEKLQQNVDKLRKGLDATSKEIENQRQAVIKAEESLELYNKRIDALASSAEGAAGGMDKLFGTNMSSMIDRTKTLGISVSGVANAWADYAKELDQVSVGLARTTGYGQALQGAFNKAHLEIGKFGGNMQELGEAMGQLSVEYSRFNALSENQMTSMAAQGVEFQKLGVSAGQFAQTQEALSYAFGITDEAMQGATTSMDKFAMSTGQPISKVLNDLTSLAPELARFGKAGERVFKNLSRQARQLGLSTQAAFDITELFDTFDGAANAAGRLNAQLGLQVNSVELMTADSDERLELLRQEFALQGKSFALMGKRDKQMVAEILGTDVMTAGKAFGEKIPLSKLAKETERKPGDFATLDEVGKAISEGKFKRQNLLISQATTQAKNIGLKAADNPVWLGRIFAAITGIAVVLAAMKAFNMVKGLRRPPGSKTPPSGPVTKSGKPDMRYKANRVPAPGKGGAGILSGVKGVGSKLAAKGAGILGSMKGMGAGLAAKSAGVLSKVGIKGLGMAMKKIPIIGSLPSIAFAVSRAMEGDFVGASMEVASAASNLANVVAPGFGTAGSLAIDAALMARDMGVIGSKGSSPKQPQGMGTMAKAAKAVQRQQNNKPVNVQGITVPVTLTMDNREVTTVVANVSNQLLNPVTPMSAQA